MASRNGQYFGPAIEWEFAPLHDGIFNLDKRLDAGVAGVMEYWDSRIEAAMKKNAPWTDRTGNARNGLTAKAGHQPLVSHWIDMFHRVPYGIWLEVRWAGKYAVVIPTLVTYGPRVMQMMTKLMDRLGGGASSGTGAAS